MAELTTVSDILSGLLTHTYVFGEDYGKVEVFILSCDGCRYHGWAPELRITHAAETVEALLDMFRSDMEDYRLWEKYSVCGAAQ